MNIQFHKVTWYSKFASIALFLGIFPILTFYLGMRYQEAKSIYSYPVFETPLKSAEVPSNFLLFKSDAGFEFKYPPEWHVLDAKEVWQDGDSRALAQILNIDRVEVIGGSIEQFSVSEANTPCSEAATINFAGKRASDTGWVSGGGILGDLLFRSICIQRDTGSIHIQGESLKESKELMDLMFTSFTFSS